MEQNQIMEEEMPVSSASRAEQTQIGMSSLDPDVIRYILDSSPELTILENELLGRYFNTERGSWESSKFTIARINEQGIKHLMSDMRIRISKLTTQSKLKERMINTIVKRYAFNTALWLFKYEKEWEIRSIADRTMILRLLVDTYLLTLQRAEGGWSGNSLSKIYHKTDSFSERPQAKKGIRKIIPF